MFYDDGQVTLYSADGAEAVKQLPLGSVDCVVTSPPYWGLRDYGVRSQLGIEPRVEDYVARLAGLFDGLAQILSPRGTVWLNLGDSYGGSWGNYVAKGSTARTAPVRLRSSYGSRRPPQSAFRAKDLVGVPWRVAFALMERGWLVHREIIWHKPNARPESMRDRFAHRYETIFELARDRGETGAETAVWTVSADRGRVGHPAVGTLEIARRCVRLGCRPGGTVLDPFSGSGTTGLAAREHRCRYIGIDINPDSHALALRRLGLS
ncbi:site-specific DNA-methyltransferase [Amycolatopsis sp. SID8362]|uniref:DNA-methyltransferase n=1 Tax=Amycolatopsis sp. SID8362 TaxID=2690346 RepID=UPI00136AB625|nr:site-specific DNA-methyltransferase [Amycolatopsis sp. SID8362]NBH07737.1 site-specific DNA-methyltransferase [Amycolatopsis sp. SID8362]NED44432.1 site-specific DNA-methyltransferase [Amycolatopsis sp. SID8362]